MKYTDYKLGLLINFGDRGLEIKRRIFDKARVKLSHLSALPSASIRVDKKGFTLIEMLVSVSIFAIFSVSIIGIYVAALRASRQTIYLSQSQQEAQLIMSVLAKKIRFSQIDYQYYESHGGMQDYESRLALVDPDGTQYLFSAYNDNLYVVNAGQATAIPSGRINIESLDFVIKPHTDPFSLSAAPTEQPRVTMAMSISARNASNLPQIIIQQTVPQRISGF